MKRNAELQAHIDQIEQIKTGVAELSGAIRTGITATDWFEDAFTAHQALKGLLQTLEAQTNWLFWALERLPQDADGLLAALSEEPGKTNDSEAHPAF